MLAQGERRQGGSRAGAARRGGAGEGSEGGQAGQHFRCKPPSLRGGEGPPARPAGSRVQGGVCGSAPLGPACRPTPAASLHPRPTRPRPPARLPALRHIAPEYYSHLKSYPTWLHVFWQFITDPSVGIGGVMVKRASRTGAGSVPSGKDGKAQRVTPPSAMPLLRGITAGSIH